MEKKMIYNRCKAPDKYCKRNSKKKKRNRGQGIGERRQHEVIEKTQNVCEKNIGEGRNEL